MAEKIIGGNRREAITWMQDLMRCDRAFAETGIQALVEARLLTFEDKGAILAESADNDSIKKRTKEFNHVEEVKKAKQNHFRRHSRQNQRKKNQRLMSHDFSDVADAMIFGYGSKDSD